MQIWISKIIKSKSIKILQCRKIKSKSKYMYAEVKVSRNIFPVKELLPGRRSA